MRLHHRSLFQSSLLKNAQGSVKNINYELNPNINLDLEMDMNLDMHMNMGITKSIVLLIKVYNNIPKNSAAIGEYACVNGSIVPSSSFGSSKKIYLAILFVE
jgi:hypothetical protein